MKKVCRMHKLSHVLLCCYRAGKRLILKRALEKFFSLMGPFMLFLNATLAESLLTIRAFERPLSCMSSFMSSLVIRLRKSLLTVGASERLFTRVSSIVHFKIPFMAG